MGIVRKIGGVLLLCQILPFMIWSIWFIDPIGHTWYFPLLCGYAVDTFLLIIVGLFAGGVALLTKKI